MGYSKLLVTLDGSKLAEKALQHLINIANPDAYIHILSVMAEDRISEMVSLVDAKAHSEGESIDQWPRIENLDDPRAINARETYLHQVTEWLEPIGYSITVEARPGKVIDTIVETARDGFEIIVMVTHGRTGISKVVLGSVAEAVLHRAPCPVLIIPGLDH